MSSNTVWTPTSWKQFPVTQAVQYPTVKDSAQSDEPIPDQTQWKKKKSLEEVVEKLNTLPPLVSPYEIEKLKVSLAAVAKGDAFLLQGGDCAELFDYCSSEKIETRLSLLLSMSLILIWGMKTPVVRIARMGGQYAKPRSKPTEMVDGKEIPSFRGDNVNGFSPLDRIPDPERLLGAYFHSSATVNHVRSVLSSGFASLPTSQEEDVPWSLPLKHVRSPELLKAYEEIVKNLSEALEFMKVVGGEGAESLDRADIWMSHEWIGDRTRSVTGAHVEFFRGLRNPIGIKVGPTSDAAELVRLLDIVDPNKEAGRVTLISRYGADLVGTLLPGHILAVQESGHPVVWCCDPMHGNTKSVGAIKTRAMHDIVTEVSESIKIHASLGSRLGGVHLELTGDVTDGFSVTECTGGSMELTEAELGLRFESYCDPRLNFEQSLDVAFMLSSQYQNVSKTRGRTHDILSSLAPSRTGSRSGSGSRA